MVQSLKAGKVAWRMRIFVQPPDVGGSLRNIVQRERTIFATMQERNLVGADDVDDQCLCQ